MKAVLIVFVLLLSACDSKQEPPQQAGISAEKLLWLADKGSIEDFKNIANTSGLTIINDSFRLDGALQYIAIKDSSETSDELIITLTKKMKIDLVSYSTINKDIVVSLRKEFIESGFKVRDAYSNVEELAKPNSNIVVMIIQVDTEENYYKIFLGEETDR
jgi:hypothetical protein